MNIMEKAASLYILERKAGLVLLGLYGVAMCGYILTIWWKHR